MGYIFISYSHQDKTYVHQLADVLSNNGFEIWIDDRIDYGTQWPIVIETAIDRCESFILVASENSRNSKWVRNELTRADRLQKQIFPVLLSGEPWLEFESTQYFDVRDRNLPDGKFFESLRSSESRRFEILRDSTNGSWAVYHDEAGNFSFRYPSIGSMSKQEDGTIQIDLPIVEGTNLRQKKLLVHFKNNGDFSSAPLKDMWHIDSTKYVDILGLKFLVESAWDAGMMKSHEWVAYTTMKQESVVTISLYLRSISPGVFTPGDITHVDLVAEKELILYVVTSFNWSD
jgi:hypothetical protein